MIKKKGMTAWLSVALVALGGSCLAVDDCAKELSDAKRHDSTMMNMHPTMSDEGRSGGLRVAFLGNSITLHGPAPVIGWTNAWGMAASAKEKDYVHLVARAIERKTGRAVELRVRNLADFERDFRSWNVERGLSDIVSFKPEYLIVALGENVPNLESKADEEAFAKAFSGLLHCFLADGCRPHGVVRGVFWQNARKDRVMNQAATDAGFAFVKADCSNQPGMTAIGLFDHKGVQNHPSDKGMREIAKRIVTALLKGRMIK